MIRTAVFLSSLLLVSCFKSASVSQATFVDKTKLLGAETEAGGAKLKAAVAADSNENQTFSATEEGSLKGTSVTIAPGTLSVSTALLVEEGVSIQETSMLSELSLPEDVSISAASQGVIVRPAESVELNKPLVISLPLPVSAGLRLVDTTYLVLAKYLDPSTRTLVNQVIPVDGVLAKMEFSDTLKADVVSLNSYFGSYWVVAVSRPLVATEVAAPKETKEPVVNKAQTSVIGSAGIIEEKSVVATQAIAPLVLATPEWSLLNERRAQIRLSAFEKVDSCHVDITEDIKSFQLRSVEAGKTFVAEHSFVNLGAHSLFARYRCRDTLGRSASSPWTQAFEVKAYARKKVLSLSSPDPAGGYGIGRLVQIDLDFDGEVFVSGIPKLALNTQGIDRFAVYHSGSGSKTLVFKFVVIFGDNISSLNVARADALKLAAGQSIVDKAGLAVSLELPLSGAASLASNSVISIDTIAPDVPIITNPALISGTEVGIVSGVSEIGSEVTVFSNSVFLGKSSTDSVGGWSVHLTQPLLDGSYSLSAKAKDIAGNLSAESPARTVVIDTLRPTINLGPAKSVNSSTTIEAQATHAASFSWSKISGPGSLTFSSLTAQQTSVDASVDGTYVIRGTVTSAAGLTEIADLSILWDRVSPSSPTISSPANSVTSSVTFISGNSESLSAVEVSVGGVLVGNSVADSDGYWSTGLGSPLNLGNHTINLRAKDLAGNWSTLASHTVAVSSPVVTANAGPDIYTKSIATLNGSFGNGVSGNWTKISGPGVISFGSPTSPITTASASVSGTYILRLTSQDGSSNSGSDDLVFVWDTAPPTFAGVIEIWRQSDTVTSIYWDPAVDALTPQQDLYYDVCYSSTIGSCQASFVPNLTFDGKTFDATITGLVSGVVYEFVLRARDRVDNPRVGAPVRNNRSLGEVRDVQVGGQHTCSLHDDNTLQCWGYNYSGELGINSTIRNVYLPKRLPLISNVESFSAGGTHSCAVLADQTVKCWGYNLYGQLGDGANTTRFTPVQVLSLTNVQKVKTGSSHSCVLLTDQTMKCWGANTSGQLGDGTAVNRNAPTLVAGLTNVKDIAVAGSRTCAILADNSLRCWGANNSGILGDGTITNQPSPIAIVGAVDVQKIFMSGSNTCIQHTDQTVKCWGTNSFGSLGDGVSGVRSTPFIHTALSGVLHLSLGDSHSCAVMSGQVVKCWGYNNFGQLGDGSTISKNTPTSVGITDALAVSVNGSHSCALLNSKNVKCWGSNASGQLGNGMLPFKSRPTKVPDLNSVVSISTGAAHTCSLLDDQTVKCWGQNTLGQLGDGTFINRSSPTAVPGLINVVALSLGGKHSCAILADQTVKCWGANNQGQLGDGTTVNRSTPATTSGLTSVQSLVLGYEHTCALLLDKSVKCWGDNNGGTLGLGVSGDKNIPTVVPGLVDIDKLEAGASHTCALVQDQTLKCWGDNVTGKIGNGTTTSVYAPIQITTSTISMSLGGSHTCALLADGTIKCWGNNYYGKLGDGTTSQRLYPTLISSLSQVADLMLGGGHSCAKMQDSSIRCWGENPTGVHGNGKTYESLVPTQIATLPLNYLHVATKYNHSCMVLSDATVKCWGSDIDGSLGLGFDLKIPRYVVEGI